MREWSGARFWLAAALLLPVLIFGQKHGLWRTGEVREVEVGREMALSGNWAVPFYDGEVFLEKPPLIYASVALAFRIADRITDNVAHFVSFFYAGLAVLATVLLGRRLRPGRLGLWAGLILATGTLFFERSHQCSLDIPLTAWVVLCLFCFYRIYQKDKPAYGFLEVLPFYCFATLAFYTKGFIGLVLPGAAVVTFLLWMRDAKAVWRIKPWFGALLFLALTLPWFVEIWRQGGQHYLWIFFVENHFYRFLNRPEISDLGHHTVWYWYFTIIWQYFKPWSILLVPAAVLFFRPAFREEFPDPGRKLILAWFLSEFLFLTLSSTKREVYLLPLFPAAALAVAAWIEFRAGKDPGPIWERVVMLGFAGLLVGLAVALPLYCAIEPQAGTPWALAAIPIALLFSGWTCYDLLKKNWPRAYPLAMAATWALALAAAVFYVPIYSLSYDASPFTRRIGPLIQDGEVIYALKVHNTMGYIPFYLHQPVKDLREEEDLAQLARSPSPIYVVIIGQSPRVVRTSPGYVRERGARLKLLAQETMGNRANALWRLLPAGAEEGSGL